MAKYEEMKQAYEKRLQESFEQKDQEGVHSLPSQGHLFFFPTESACVFPCVFTQSLSSVYITMHFKQFLK